ncbi:hypothetical protein MUGA111182_15975 [Mucilaginibacter galii]|uniref:Periplasmic heavy metal sensor n=1 Tax=Mucilaginibacter galii TaxID=2005073 RepID=A0A917J8K8_9SPHI|nr:hypothetical protein [Mucilaginibacter galii]GGI50506.1 hypothetical protein GCM10011425_17180 [Mucilaginibacter galii]
MNRLLKHLVFILMLFTGYEVYSQPPASFRSSNNGRNKVESYRENYVDRQLNLNEDQKAKFWPVYRQYHDEITSVKRAKRQNILTNKSRDQMQKDLQFDQQLIDIKRRYNQEFMKIMPADKVAKIYQSEREFNDELFKQLGERSNPD